MRKLNGLAFLALIALGCTQPASTPVEPQKADSGSVGMDRTILPITEPVYPTTSTLDARDAKAPLRFEVKAPAKAPNVVIVLIDDIGFGASSAFGGPIHMPTLDKLAAEWITL